MDSTIKCVVVGDGAVGKTSLLLTYTIGKFPTKYEPTIFDNYAVEINVDGKKYTLGLFDTAGQEDFDRLRSLAYGSTDVYIVCFSVAHPSSFENIEEKWVPEILHYSPNVPFILVGTQIDLRDNNNTSTKRTIKTELGQKLAKKLRAAAYVECSALTTVNIKDVFDEAIMAVLNQKRQQPSKPQCKIL